MLAIAAFVWFIAWPACNAYSNVWERIAAGFAQPLVLNVLAEPSKVDTESWEYVSQQGTDEEVLAQLAGLGVAEPHQVPDRQGRGVRKDLEGGSN